VFDVDGIHSRLAGAGQVGVEEFLGELTQTLTPLAVSLFEGMRNALEDEIDGVRRAQHHCQTHRYRPLCKYIKVKASPLLLHNAKLTSILESTP
jgi:hypothetical protein